MKRGYLSRIGLLLVVSAMLCTTTGCRKLPWGTNVASAVTGWLLGSVVTFGNVERQCYQNGQLIDCADLPADLGS